MELFAMWENLPRILCFAFLIRAIILPKTWCQTNRNELTVQHQTNVDRANAFSSLPNSLHVRGAEKVFLLPLDIGATFASSPHTASRYEISFLQTFIQNKWGTETRMDPELKRKQQKESSTCYQQKLGADKTTLKFLGCFCLRSLLGAFRIR